MTITLHGGPWNGLEIEDRGQVMIRMCIYEAKIPIVGQKVGTAFYERDGENAFWLTNRWDAPYGGILNEEIDASSED